MTTERWHQKADALSEAWTERYGSVLPVAGVALALGPAQLETRCGDAWPGPDGLVGTDDDERNWGACTLRSLNAEERAAVAEAGLRPTVGPGHNEIARKAQQAVIDAGLPIPSGTVAGSIPVSGATIHCDSRTVKDANGKPVTIPHFVWFANFATHKDGAAYYLHLLGDGSRKVLQAGGSGWQLAEAMYRRGYYGGFHPHAMYTGKDGQVHDGNRENIAAYANLINRFLPEITLALRTWRTDSPPPTVPLTLRKGSRGDDVKRVQEMLHITADGIFGPQTEGAVRSFQIQAGLVADGIVGPKTWAALVGWKEQYG